MPHHDVLQLNPEACWSLQVSPCIWHWPHSSLSFFLLGQLPQTQCDASHLVLPLSTSTTLSLVQEFLFPDLPSALSAFHSLLMSPHCKSHSSKAINFSGMNYSFDNSAISHSHRVFGDFDVDILQNSIHSFCQTGCQWCPQWSKNASAKRREFSQEESCARHLQ